MTKCHIEDNNIVPTTRIHIVVSSKSHNFFFEWYGTTESRKSFRHIVMGICKGFVTKCQPKDKSGKENITMHKRSLNCIYSYTTKSLVNAGY